MLQQLKQSGTFRFTFSLQSAHFRSGTVALRLCNPIASSGLQVLAISGALFLQRNIMTQSIAGIAAWAGVVDRPGDRVNGGSLKERNDHGAGPFECRW
jgi:hypothetical protein